ncbi:hypothetical protein [Burkholderia multivorans]|uniref:hypothetical protein n=1 Tax=Burkholderia multivorans TaxID=87883 RepID=UPI002019D4AA|nr:hypothetical protein [Burkholderia multivorans]MCA8142942.1 hypothetical protein [Burkholderia multivorans]MCO1368465.1 hypothetical protein [Burkholderia multivorans]MCO1380356.1 hypothetical protein [Burkholderia multivorans]MDN8028746.1 hypothetical protein [Burkholderia multivorans]UQP21527.1 hypothetical protein L0Y98_18935 [Burkholderia multivorans]
MLIGAFLKGDLDATLVAIPVMMATVGLVLVFLGRSTVATACLLAIRGLIGTAATVGWRT